MAAIRIAGTGTDILRCFTVMAELRTHLVADEFLERVAAHRFYLRNRMSISAHHFSLKL